MIRKRRFGWQSFEEVLADCPRKILVKDLNPTKPDGFYYCVDLNKLKHPELWEGLVGMALLDRDRALMG